MNDEKVTNFISLCNTSAQNRTLKNVVFSAANGGDILKVKGTPGRNSAGNIILRLEYSLTEGRVRQESLLLSDIAPKLLTLCGQFSHCDLNDSGGSASLMTSKKGKITLIAHGKIGTGEKQEIAETGKNYALDGTEPFLYHLGISDKNGRVHDKKQGKFRQINRFLEYVGDMMKYLPRSGEIRIADLCCGKSYLSFAVYHYFVNILERPVLMDCVDLKESVMDYCRDIASKCGFNGMRFTAGDVNKYSPDEPPHMVISLHACDIATDIVIDRAITLGAEVILSTPCCHRDLSRKLNCSNLKFISDNSVLKSKFCDAATDSLRILRLKACGYSAFATELVDPEDTPKNVLIRAHKDHGFDYGRREKYKNEYAAAYRFLCNDDAPDLPQGK